MSTAPPRTDEEVRAIEMEANHLWEEGGRPLGKEVDYWLEAEAMLEASTSIGRRPIAIPISVTFRTIDVADGDLIVNFRAVMPPSPVKTSTLVFAGLSEDGFAAITPDIIRPETLAHECRLVATQVMAITGAADRVSRFIEWNAGASGPYLQFFEATSDAGETLLQLKSAFREALLEPDLNSALISQIDVAMNSHGPAIGVTADVKSICLGSNLIEMLQFVTSNWETAVTGFAILTGGKFSLKFAESFGERFGTLSAEYAGRRLFSQPADPPHRGIRGEVEVHPSAEVSNFVETVERHRRAKSRNPP